MSVLILRSSAAGGSPSVPAWFSALGNKQWATPVSNWLGDSSVKDPLAVSTNVGGFGHASIVQAWVGMGCDQTRKTVFLLGNGGHNDYYGNEVYACDLSQSSPAWTRKRNATAADGSGDIYQFSDGRPSSDHTAGTTVGAEGRWIKAGMASTNYIAFGHQTRWWEFDPLGNDWTLTTISGITGVSYAPSITAVFDPIDRQIIQCPAQDLYFVDLDTLTIAATHLQLCAADGTPSCELLMAVDTTHHILLTWWKQSGKFYVLDLANKANTPTAITATGTGPAVNTACFYWHAASGAFITWDDGQGLRKLTPTLGGTNGYTALAWSGVAGNGATPPSASSVNSVVSGGMYNKIQLINDMGDGTAALVILPQYSNPDIFVCRLTGAI